MFLHTKNGLQQYLIKQSKGDKPFDHATVIERACDSPTECLWVWACWSQAPNVKQYTFFDLFMEERKQKRE